MQKPISDLSINHQFSLLLFPTQYKFKTQYNLSIQARVLYCKYYPGNMKKGRFSNYRHISELPSFFFYLQCILAEKFMCDAYLFRKIVKNDSII